MPRIVSWAPELLSAIITLVVLAYLAKNRVFLIPAKYIVFFSLFLLFLVVGIIANQVQPGAVFSGLRRYFRYAPFF